MRRFVIWILSDFTIDITDDDCKGVHVGGLIGGILTQVNVINCSTKGNINLVINNGDSFQGAFVGGLIGKDTNLTKIQNSYATGNIDVIYSGDEKIYVGYISNGNAVIENCYRYNEQIISVPSDSEICKAGTSADMQTIWTFVSNTWDSEIWDLYTDKNPTLK